MKNAKKSMFITTILMVAVLIVAVSTATFAWYTASGTGSATGAVVQSAASGDANIAVDWVSNGHGTNIVFNAQNALQPMVPQADYAADTKYGDFLFDSASVDVLTGKFNAVNNPGAWTVGNALIENGEGAEDDIAANQYTSFYVINHNVDNPVNVTMTATFTGDLADMVNVAVFFGGDLKVVFNNAGAKYTVGPVVEGALANALVDSAANAVNGATGYTFELPANGGNVQITVKAWLDGEMLTSPDAGKNAGFSFNFNQA